MPGFAFAGRGKPIESDDLDRASGVTWQQALDLLASVYGWFTEGLDTVDLKAAKALLDELS
jgi:hypothetical protein